MADKAAEAEAVVRELPEGYPEKEAGSDPQSNLPTVKVSKGDMPDAEPHHTLAEKSDVFDPNAALRNKLGIGPGLQDSEAKNPAVWSDVGLEGYAKSEADKMEKDAKRAYDRAKARAEALRKGEPDPYPNG
jgi:hypothetical protein